ncbi:MAG: histidine kinase N-terminal 7TM domain-containing protein, partial [Woeseia sp.]
MARKLEECLPMMWEYTDYVWPFLISVLVSIALGLYTWQRRDVRACLPLIVLIAMAGYWSLASGLHALAVGLGPKVLLSDLHYPAIVTLPVAWFAFALAYTGRRNTLTPGQIAGLLIVPALTLVLIATNANHGLVFKEATLDTSGPIPSASRTYGVWFWVHTAYSYALIVVGVALILFQRIHAPTLYRRQSTLMVTGALIPFFANIIFLSIPSWFANIDMTPIAFTASCVFFGVGLFWFRLLDLMPVAHTIIFESISEAIVVLDTQRRVVDLNPAARRLFAETAPANAIGMPITDLAGGLDFIPEEAVAAAIAGEIVLMMDGKKRFFEWQMSPLQDCHDRIPKCLVMLVLRDITEQKQTVQALQESEERYRTLVEHAPDAIVTLDMKTGYFVDCNREAELFFGLSREQLMLMDPIRLSPRIQPDGRLSAQAVFDEYRRAVAGEVCSYEWTHRNAAGDNIPCEIRLIRLPSTDRVLIRGSITNIAERKRAEVAFREHHRMQRLDSLGALAGGVAHDMNNILGSVLLSLEWLGMTTQDENTRKLLTTVETSVHRGADLVRQLLTFARGVEGELTTLSLKLTILQLEEILQQTLPPSVVFVSDIDEDLWDVLGDATQLHQVLMNLCINAADAMPSGGLLSLTAENRVVEQPQAGHQREIPPGRHVVLSVSDTGTGMPPEERFRSGPASA